jgi:ubiquitin-protein ligase
LNDFCSEVKITIYARKICSTFTFRAFFSEAKYPYKAPLVYLTSCYGAPQKDLELIQNFLDDQNRVLLPLLCDDWSPVLTLSMMVFALELLVCEPPSAQHPSVELQRIYYERQKRMQG